MESMSGYNWQTEIQKEREAETRGGPRGAKPSLKGPSMMVTARKNYTSRGDVSAQELGRGEVRKLKPRVGPGPGMLGPVAAIKKKGSPREGDP